MVQDRLQLLYHTYCTTCHGDTAVSGGTMPDLRYAAALRADGLFQSIVHDGVLQSKGMVAFGSLLDPKAIELIRAYVTHRVNESVAEQTAPAAH